MSYKFHIKPAKLKNPREKPMHDYVFTKCNKCQWTGKAIDWDGAELLAKTHASVHEEEDEGVKTSRLSSWK